LKKASEAEGYNMGNRSVIHLECVSCRKSDVSGVSRYTTTKNKKKTQSRLELKKYCKFEKKHTIHKEGK
jgi:large subunit ribosomal protein L33